MNSAGSYLDQALRHPGLADALEHASVQQLRRIAAATADLALERRPVDDRRIAAALQALREGHLGSAVRRRLEELVEELDLIQYKLEEGYDRARTSDEVRAGFDEYGPKWLEEHELPEEVQAKGRDYDKAADRARAAAALLAALDESPLVAAKDAVYEAWAALGDEESDLLALRATVTNLIG